MLTLLAPLFLLQTPLPQIEIRVEKSIGLDTPAVCCSQSKGQAKIGDTPKRVRSLKQAWLDHQKSGKNLSIQNKKTAYAIAIKAKKATYSKGIKAKNSSFGWTTKPPIQDGYGPIVRGKAIFIDDSGTQRVMEFDGDFPDIQDFLPAGVCFKSETNQSCGKPHGCLKFANGCGKAQGCSVQKRKFGKTDAPQRFQNSKAFVFEGSPKGLPGHFVQILGSHGADNASLHSHDEENEIDFVFEGSPKGLPGHFVQIHSSHSADNASLHSHDEENEIGEVIEACFKTHKAHEEAYDRIDELEERLAHMERLLEHMSDELIHEDH
jgi:hypothetical protein